MHSSTTVPETESRSALLYVCSPILHPIAARAGDVLAWFPARGISVVRLTAGRWMAVRALTSDDAPALARLVADRVLIPHHPEDATTLRQLLPRPTRRRRALRALTHVPLTLHRTPAGVGA